MVAWTQGYRDRDRPEAPAEGDLHYDKSARYALVRHVEHGDSVVRVTDVYDGESWVQYDPGPDQFVITVPKGYNSPAQVVQRIVDMSIGHETRWMLDSRVSHRIGNAVAAKLGLDDEINAELDATPMTARVDALEDVRLAVIKLLTVAPEHGYHRKLAELGAEVDNVGYAENADDYEATINGNENNDGSPLPVLSEPVYYAILGGKEDGRVMTACLERLMLVAGVNEEDLG